MTTHSRPQPLPVRVAFWAAYSILSVLFVAATIELAIRWLGVAPPTPSQFVSYSADDILPFRPQPSTVLFGSKGDTGEFAFERRHNSMGFRDVEHEVEKPPGVFRILGLGDSFTYGYGAAFEDSYLRQLEIMLNQRSGVHPRVEVIKAGIPRYWPEPERVLLERIGVLYEPDLVLVGFVPNDIADTYLGMNYNKVRDGYLLTREADELGRFGLWLYLRSHAARIALKALIEKEQKKKQERDPSEIAWREFYQDDGHHEEEWREIEQVYLEMAGIAQSVEAKLVVVHLPMNASWESADYPARRLARLTEHPALELVDTLPSLREASRTEPIYWKIDRHPNPAGHRAIAVAVFEAITDRGFVP